MAKLLAVEGDLKPLQDQSHLPFSDTFLCGKKRYYIREWEAHMCTSLAFYVEKRNERRQNEESHLNVGDLPDDILVELFRYLHPCERIESVSLVCRRWYRLLYTASIWKELCVPHLKAEHAAALKHFLQKICGSLQKLYIGLYEDASVCKVIAKIGDVLPDLLPQITHFEAVDFACKGTWREFFRRLDSCMPKLRTLLVAVYLGAPFGSDEPLVDVTFFNTPMLFPNLRRFSFNGISTFWSAVFVEDFLSERPLLEQFAINFYDSSTEDMEIDSDSSIKIGSLKGLCLKSSRRFVPAIQQMLNVQQFLVFLELIEFAWEFHISTVRNLHFLEHLHIDFAGDNGDPHYRELFELPSSSSYFPSRLRYLRIDSELTIDTVRRIVDGCPDLRSVHFRADNEPLALRIMADSLRKLRFLRIIYASSFLSLLGEADEPNERVFPSLFCLMITSATFPLLPNSASRREDGHGELSRLARARRNLIILCGEMFITHKCREGRVRLNDDQKRVSLDGASRMDRSIGRTLELEEGYCCVKGHLGRSVGSNFLVESFPDWGP